MSTSRHQISGRAINGERALRPKSLRALWRGSPRVALTLGTLLALAGSSTAGATVGSVPARSAASFSESVGVNTHVGFSDTVYGQQWPMVRDRLVELGVKHVRDGSYREGTRLVDVVPRYRELAGLGVRGNLLAGDPLGRYGSGSIDEHLAWVKRNVASFTETLEGPNEYDYVESDWAVNLRAYQCEWARKIRGDEVLSTKAVIAPSSRRANGFDSSLGDLSACLDFGNLHPYPGAQSPDRTNLGDLSVSLAGAQSTSATKPVWVTESGYHNAVNCSGCGGHHPASERAAGVYLPRLFMENFRRGIPRTYSYELIDQRPDPEKDDPEQNFGLVRNDGSPKPAFVALRNLLTILADRGSASGKLAFSLQCSTCPEPLRQVLLRKSTGAYYLVVWRESSVWNRVTRTDITNDPRPAELELSSPSRLEIFEPARSTTPIDTATGASHRIALTDRLTILKITPPTETPTPTPAPPSTPEPEPAGPVPAIPAPATSAPAPVAPLAPTGEPPLLHPAKLEVTRSAVRPGRGTLEVLAPITKRASGEVQVDFHAAGRHTRFAAPVNAAEGSVRFRQPLPREQAQMGTGIITLAYPGNDRTRGQEVRLRAASGRARLEPGRPSVRDGRLRARGSISERARGVVRVQLTWTTAGQDHSLELDAPIRDGRWALDKALPASVLQQIADRDGTVHSYTLFTGYFPARMGGEMQAYQVLGAP